MEFKNKNPKIIVVSGRAGSGKDTACNMIKKYYKDLKVINLSYASYLKQYAMNITSWDGCEETKPRDLLQQLGVELIKNNIDEEMLVKRIVEDIKVYSYFFDIITISDARFPNEIDSIKENFQNVTSIRINKNEESKLTKEQQMHKTETAMDEYSNYDYIINNNKDIKYLEEEVLKCIK